MLYLACQVPPGAQGCRLDGFLRAQGLSAGLIRAVKHQCDGFFADGAPIHTNMPLTAGQTLTFALPPDPPTQVEPQPVDFGILSEDAFVAVLDKPAGLAVHPTLNYPDRTLANGWLWHLKQSGRTGVFRPVNRIDKNTSGLVLCAGNAFAAPILAESAHKCYLAVAEGLLPEDDGSIDAPIARRGDSIIGRTVAPDGKPSVTRYRVLARGGGHTLVACIPVTGRTHQIRVHMSHLGCPLAGDTLYGGHTDRIGRHALHCAALTFRHPLDDALRRMECSLPPDMVRLCASCGMPPVQTDTLFALIQELAPETGVEPKTPFAYFIRENDKEIIGTES